MSMLKQVLQFDELYFKNIVVPQAHLVADHFGLTLKKISRKYFNEAGSMITLGLCCPAKKEIRILLRAYLGCGKWSDRFSDRDIMWILSHELAHLKYAKHDKQHEDFTQEIFNFIWYRSQR